jgi:hypothetical protein
MLQQQQEGAKGTLGTARLTMGGVNSAREKSVGLQKQITILENRLEKQYIKYNEVGAKGVLTCVTQLPGFASEFGSGRGGRQGTPGCVSEQRGAGGRWQVAGTGEAKQQTDKHASRNPGSHGGQHVH